MAMVLKVRRSGGGEGRAPVTRMAGRVGLTAAILLGPSAAHAQDAARLRLALEKLRVLGSVLYVGAHPDDENTALLAAFAQGRLMRTAYLSLTRGSGGQNLIGPEQGPLLGVIRTEELLAARGIDGAEQYFTRAIDFGYSKSPDEAFAIWGREKVLADVVRVIRTFRPDVIITRFPTTGEGGHGHHTASAILAVEAFTAAGDASRFTEQAGTLAPWAPRRLFWNAWRPQVEGRTEDMPRLLTLQLGAYNPLIGVSYAELAARARSMHKSQGFGSAPRYGQLPNYLEQLAGEPAQADPFEWIDTTWGRLAGGKAVDAILVEAIRGFDMQHPDRTIPGLVKAMKAMDTLAPDPWVDQKRREVAEVIRGCAGLWLEATAAAPSVAPGEGLKVNATAVDRAGFPLVLASVAVTWGATRTLGAPLGANLPLTTELAVKVPEDAPFSQPYWLAEPPGAGTYTISNDSLVTLADSPPALVVRFVLEVDGYPVAFEVPVEYERTDPVRGEVRQRVEVLPAVVARPEGEVVVFPDASPRAVRVTLTESAPTASNAVEGVVRTEAPGGWTVEPASAPFAFARAGEDRVVAFTVTPPAGESVGALRTVVEVGGRSASWSAATIDYPHIPPRTVLQPATARLVRVPIQVRGRSVGYVMGPGDEVPGVLRQLGYEVTLLSDADLESGDLARFDVVVTGVRAYNTRDRLAAAQPRLLSYVEQGGTLVEQYNNSRGLVTERLGPFPLTLSRDRITVEDAPVSFALPFDPLLTTPNRITREDFDGWVQERGLYFPESWDPRYDAPLASSDPGEQPLRGGVLHARYGKGTFVYTSLSFFRQLPAGVPGAIRLFENLLAGGRARE